jgi:pSer/pThr/pTyr-binding forkhead associated (FHA) protein
MQAVLVMIRSDGERRSFSIARDMTVVGRREDCDLRIPLGEISRKHCRLVRDDETLRLEDLGSSNGTYHNGQRVQECVLAAGDTIQIGPVVFVLQLDGVPADEELHPVASPGLETTETDMQANVTEAEYEGQDVPIARVVRSDSPQEEYVAEEEVVAEEDVTVEEDVPVEEELVLEEESAVAEEELPQGELPEEAGAEAGAEAGEAELVFEEEPQSEAVAGTEAAGHEAEAEELFLPVDGEEPEGEELTLDHLDIDADAHHPK